MIRIEALCIFFMTKNIILKGPSHETDFKKFLQKSSELGLSNGSSWFSKFLRGSDDFKVHKVYLLRLMPVWVGSTMLAAFLSFLLITSVIQLYIDKNELACCLYCTKSGWRSVCHFPPALAYNLHSRPAKGKQGPLPEEMSQTLLTNKNQGHLD